MRDGTRRAGRDTAAAAIAIGTVVVLTLGVTRLLVPRPPATDASQATTTTTTPVTDPLAEAESRVGPTAVLDTTGVVTARLVLDRVQPTATIGRGPDGSTNDIDVTYEGSGAQLTLKAGDLRVGDPRTDPLTVVLVVGGKTYIAHTGNCTLTVTRFEYIPSHGQLVPSYAGTLACADLTDRDGGTLSTNGGFDY